MRVVFIGAGELSLVTARILYERGHEVIIMERDMDRITSLREQFEYGFIHGDGSAPHILEEAAPEKCDYLFCLTDSDRDNIIASLVGRSLGFERVVTRIEDPEFEHVCNELGLTDTIVPSRTISRYLADMLEGISVLELSATIKGEARLFSFTAKKSDAGNVEDLKLPDDTKVICLYRNDKLRLAEPGSTLEKGDEVVLITRSTHLKTLSERWSPKKTSDE